MEWVHGICWFLGGAFLANAIPHLVSGTTGRAFQSPFASPSGKGLSSPMVNVLWGAFNLAAGYALICHVGSFDLHAPLHVATAGFGGLLISLHAARHFGQFYDTRA